ncbi:hypothetical protein FA13DRAFT_1730201 [Coprinellus micaceus]|uniref:Uncharacterized protein n=1 Tax=Coprinellus micaceus TaxID=71717 RepID=A0A4Y7TIU2_COPMI|nr:hypothetical protein FA13DRAFT_1730201 [Coprinellus micaceus]
MLSSSFRLPVPLARSLPLSVLFRLPTREAVRRLSFPESAARRGRQEPLSQAQRVILVEDGQKDQNKKGASQ